MNASDSSGEVETRHFLAPVVIGFLAFGLMFVISVTQGLPIRDPDARFVGSPLVLIVLIVLGFLLLDLLSRALRQVRSSGGRLLPAGRDVFLERWWGRRGVIVLACLVGFYATYLSYRNLKSYVPFLTGGEHDTALLHLDRAIFFGHDPATLLHDLLGTGVAAHVLSVSYLAFLSFVPISIGVALICSTRVAAGVWYVTALALNWMLGALSYFLIPSLGPLYARPRLFLDLPDTGVTELRAMLLEHRSEVLADPNATDAVQGIAAFASLHVAVIFTAALIAHRVGAPRVLRIGLWCYVGLTTLATIYFGWHYVIDDVAGLAIGALATYAAAVLVGFLPGPLTALGRLSQQDAGATS